MHKDVGKRVMALLLSICMIAGMVDWSGFTVRSEGETVLLTRIKILDTFNREYTGSALEPGRGDIEVYVQKYDSEGNEVGDEKKTEDYQIVSYGSATNARESGSITVKGINSVEEEITGSFQIVPKNIQESADGISVDSIATQYVTVNGDVRPLPTVRYRVSGSTERILTTNDFDCKYENNVVSDANEGGTGTITIEGKGNYTGSRTATFLYEKMKSENLKIELQTGDVGSPCILRAGDSSTNNIKYKNFDGNPAELDKTRDVKVTYEKSDRSKEELNENEF